MRREKGIYKRQDGRYEGRFIKGRDADGKAIYGFVYDKSYTVAKKRLNDAKTAISQNQTSEVSPETIIEVIDDYLTRVKVKYKATSLAVYERHLRNHILPFFGEMNIKDLTQEQVQKFANSLIINGLAVITAQAVISFMGKALKHHVSSEIFEIEMPKKEKHEVAVLTRPEQKRVEFAAKSFGNSEYVATMLCLYSGLRIGEVTALQWEDIDFNSGVLYIRHNLGRVCCVDGEHKTQLQLLTPKSESSYREVPIQGFILDVLREHKRTSVSKFVVNDGYNWTNPRTLQNRFKRILENAHVDDINFHAATRHTFVTRALEMNIGIKTISETLGHSSADTTLRSYAHVLKDVKRQQLESLSAVYA